MRKQEVVVGTKQAIEVHTAFGVSFILTVSILSLAVLLDTFILAFAISIA